MTTEQQIKALAELDGLSAEQTDKSGLWSLVDKYRCYYSYNCGISEEHIWRVATRVSYLTSYDAIIPLIQKQSVPQIIEIDAVMFFKLRCALDATPSQLCEALLRATGKWIE